MRKYALILAGLASLSTLNTAPANAAQSYLMTCRGGGSMSSVVGQRVSNPHVFIEINYKRARQGSDFRAPRAGECAWADRGVRANEPTKIYFKDTGTKWAQTVCDSRGCRVKTPSRHITQLSNAINSGRSFQLYVYNDRNGKMIVTRVGGAPEQAPPPRQQGLSALQGAYQVTHMPGNHYPDRLVRISPEIVARSRVTIDRRQSVNASLGCNSIEVNYRVRDSGHIEPIGPGMMTRRGCERYQHRLDSSLVQALERTRSVVRQGNTVTFRDQRGRGILQLRRL